MIRPGVKSFAVRIAASPIGPAPTIATVSPGCDAAVQHADLVRGREDVGEEEHLLVAQLVGHLVDGRVGERHARELGLEAVDQVAEDPAAAAGAEAVAALLAEAAAAARGDARDEHAVARLERRDRVADLDDRADGLVAEDRPGLHLGDVALEDVQVGPADRRRVDADDRVGRLLDRGSGTSPRRAGRARGRRVLSWLLLSSSPTLVARARAPSAAARNRLRVSRSESASRPDGRRGRRAKLRARKEVPDEADPRSHRRFRERPQRARRSGRARGRSRRQAHGRLCPSRTAAGPRRAVLPALAQRRPATR